VRGPASHGELLEPDLRRHDLNIVVGKGQIKSRDIAQLASMAQTWVAEFSLYERVADISGNLFDANSVVAAIILAGAEGLPAYGLPIPWYARAALVQLASPVLLRLSRSVWAVSSRVAHTFGYPSTPSYRRENCMNPAKKSSIGI
jgi:hypothetical protein